MATPNLSGPSAYDSDSDADEILEQYDGYIVDLARNKVPRNAVHPEMLRDEIDELAQKVRLKLWLALRKRYIANPKAYIRCIVSTEAVDMVRQCQPTFPLPLDDDGELHRGNVIAMLSEGMRDPAYEVEQEEALEASTRKTLEAILKLPLRQRQALICSLKDQLDDALPLINALRNHIVNIDEIRWPTKKNELQRLRASLSVARKKLRAL